MADAGARIDIGDAHRHDLTLEPHFHFAERHLVCAAFFPFEIGAAGQGADMVKHRVDPGAWYLRVHRLCPEYVS